MAALGAALVFGGWNGARAADPEARPPKTEEELRFWLEDMVWYHRYSLDEMELATGLDPAEIRAGLKRFEITPASRPQWRPSDPLFVLPYPGGRHPRIGFLEGAIRPQRETKFSVFLPWDPASYVVVDLPEAIWSNLGLTYLAHTHVPTIWTRQKVELEKLEWSRLPEGQLRYSRRLPNGIEFGARVKPRPAAVRMQLWLRNGTSDLLKDLRIQNCVMLKGAAGFNSQTNANKRFENPYAVCRSDDGNHWIITAWQRCQHPWGNAPVPCLHSDPKFPDCPPGSTERLEGWLSFFQGPDLEAELARIKDLEWWNDNSWGPNEPH